jgi:hypothetical protein
MPHVVVALKIKKCRYIEIIQTFGIAKIISDIKVIYATRRYFSVAANSQPRKI